MSYSQKRISFFLLAVFFPVMIFFGAGGADGRLARASFFDNIRAFVTINPLSVELLLPDRVEEGDIFNVRTEVMNNGEEKIENAKAEIFLPSGLSLRGRGAAQKIGVIQGGKKRKADWRVRADIAGNYVITVSAKGELKGDVISAEDSKILTAAEGEAKEEDGREKSSFGRRQLRFFQDIFSFLNSWLGQ